MSRPTDTLAPRLFLFHFIFPVFFLSQPASSYKTLPLTQSPTQVRKKNTWLGSKTRTLSPTFNGSYHALRGSPKNCSAMCGAGTFTILPQNLSETGLASVRGATPPPRNCKHHVWAEKPDNPKKNVAHLRRWEHSNNSKPARTTKREITAWHHFVFPSACSFVYCVFHC